MSGQQTRKWILSNPPTKEVVLDGENTTFSLETATLPALEEGQVLVKTLYISNDPAQRGWIEPTLAAERSYVNNHTNPSSHKLLYTCQYIHIKEEE